jgi:sugar/nucleoside kinase (ribokinase family)
MYSPHAVCCAQVVAAARGLMKSGVSSVLVTLSERGAVLVLHNGTVITQPALPVPGGVVVDGTAAGGVWWLAMLTALRLPV